jgi:hypothetical protein
MTLPDMKKVSTLPAELSRLVEEKPGIPASDFGDSVFQAFVDQIGGDLSENDAKKIVLARGVIARMGLEAAEGGSLSAEEFANALGRTRQAVNYLRRRRRVIAWRNSYGKWRYPAWQLTAEGRPLQKAYASALKRFARAVNGGR